MIVNARYAVPCVDSGASTDEPCDETCLSQLVTAPPAVPLPRAELRLGEHEGLSAGEAAVVSFIVAGLPNQEIAGALSISTYSVKTHIRSAYRKMGVASRTQAIVWGVNHGFQLSASAARLNDGAQR